MWISVIPKSQTEYISKEVLFLFYSVRLSFLLLFSFYFREKTKEEKIHMVEAKLLMHWTYFFPSKKKCDTTSTVVKLIPFKDVKKGGEKTKKRKKVAKADWRFYVLVVVFIVFAGECFFLTFFLVRSPSRQKSVAPFYIR